MSGEPERRDDPAHAAGTALLALYDTALPQVYGYLLARCGGQAPVAQDLTAETFLAAVKAVQSGAPPDPMTTAWLVGVARHKLVDHWRRQGREERKLAAVADLDEPTDDPWDVRLDALRARATLDELAPQHRAALTLRYVDDLPVAEVATLLGRTVHATEALLSRAKASFRRAYCEEDVR
ncbi:MAG TPA: sigma-70 family RNA polymerase sigma factor [Acidimicrobiales bacterium]|nr:sigma-70 family RNA polymerase sigma factor [Acidimicrobiales bacterium]